MKKPDSTQGLSASALIDKRIADLGDWRGEALSRMRKLIKEADPEVVEEWKWLGTPVWSHGGIICTGESYKAIVKVTFAKGASLNDPVKLFNASLDGNTRRAIDIHEGEEVDAGAFKALIRSAVALNASGAKARPGRGERKMILTPAASADEYIQYLGGWQRSYAEALRLAVRECAPELDERLKWGHLVYFMNGPVLLIRAEPNRVLFGFFRGQRLRHLEPRLKPGGKYELATLELREGTALAKTTVTGLVTEATSLNRRLGDPTQAASARENGAG